MSTTTSITPGRYSDSEEVVIAQVFPTAVNSPGKSGQIAFDTTHVYVCIAENTWRRASLFTW